MWFMTIAMSALPSCPLVVVDAMTQTTINIDRVTVASATIAAWQARVLAGCIHGSSIWSFTQACVHHSLSARRLVLKAAVDSSN
jgi:hypothetical protein